MKRTILAAAIGLVAAGYVNAAGAGDAERGETLYEARCGACHSLDANRVGPKHRGVFGRAAGSVEDYRYSKAVRASGVTWSDETLDQWLTDPGALIPGNKMGFRLSKAADRADIIAYLRSVSGDEIPLARLHPDGK